MWSMGCIFAELLWSQEAKRDPKNTSQIRAIFPGNSCYPLSPKASKESNSNEDPKISSKDLLKVICRTIGTPSEADRSFISTENA